MPDAHTYRGRLAPSPTGYLHLGHARTFWTAAERAANSGGTLILRSDDLDLARCKPRFVAAMFEDLRWFGLHWSEGPDIGGPCAPYAQSLRMGFYLAAFETLRKRGIIYPCACSRQDVARALTAPHEGEDEPIYPGLCRPPQSRISSTPRAGVNWRFRTLPGENVTFHDGCLGEYSEMTGRDFGDFLVWRRDDLPSYQLACAADDAAMAITEVVRGADLLTSTCRQLLLLAALHLRAPSFFHCPLMKDSRGVRLAKRDDAASLRVLRQNGATPESLRLQHFV